MLLSAFLQGILNIGVLGLGFRVEEGVRGPTSACIVSQAESMSPHHLGLLGF